MSKMTRILAGGLLAIGVSAAYGFPDFGETEGNDTKPAANNTPLLNPGDGLTGVSTGTTGAAVDYFKVNINGGALGIYRNRLTKTSVAPNGATIRGLNQTAGGVIGTTDSSVQTQTGVITTANTAFNQWYGFGKQEMFYFRVTGSATATAGYRWEYSQQAVTPTNIGVFAPGSITITTVGQGHSTDTDMWVYDGGLQAIPGYGNDDEGPGGTTLQSRLIRNYTPGIYYLALTNFAFSNNQASNSPDEDFQTGVVTDFANIAANSSASANLNMAFAISDSAGTALAVPNTKVGAFDINWFTFRVTPEPSALALLALGGVALFRRR